MFLLIAALMALTVFGFIVTNRGGGVEVPGRIYKEYHLENYSPWLRKRLKNPRYWETIRTCILGSKTCAKIAYWTPFDYLQRDMSPIQGLMLGVDLDACLGLILDCFRSWSVWSASRFVPSWGVIEGVEIGCAADCGCGGGGDGCGGDGKRMARAVFNYFILPVCIYNISHMYMQSGCCKPPTACSYAVDATTLAQDADCYLWNNAPNLLCYKCDSCKAGVLETMRIDWRKLSILNIVMVILLICIYSVGCCAYQNTKRAQTDNPYGQNRMSKVRPRWDFYWYVKQHSIV
ncbi:hypothetical protein C3L33_23007, partial [Rhododendron williamsianum]